MFIVLEGIDGSGGGTQRKMLEEYFANFQGSIFNFHNVLSLKYPHYKDGMGKIIKEFLYEKKKLSPEHQFLLFAGQMALESPRIEEAREKGLVIADRFVTSTMAYQGMQGLGIEFGEKFIEMFGVAIPEAVIWLDVSPEAAIKRDQKGSEGEENLFEKERKELEKSYQMYQKLMDRGFLSQKWIKVDGTKSIKEVTKELINVIELLT